MSAIAEDRLSDVLEKAYLDESLSTTVTINLQALAENVRNLKKIAGEAKILAVVKGDAYGHGLIECAQTLEASRVYGFAVATIGEALSLRKNGIRSPILMLRELPPSEIKLAIHNDVHLTVASPYGLSAIENVGTIVGVYPRVHLRVDVASELGRYQFLEAALSQSNIEIEGIYSHFSSFKPPRTLSLQAQLDEFSEIAEFVEKRLGHPLIKHFANSFALLESKASHFDLIRPGDALYGIDVSRTSAGAKSLVQVMTVESYVSSIVKVTAGAWNMYGRKVHLPRATRVALVPFGYCNGYPHNFGENAVAYLGKQAYRLIGPVRMNQIALDIGDDSVCVGETIELVGNKKGRKNSIESISRCLSCPPSELTIRFGQGSDRRFTFGKASHES